MYDLISKRLSHIRAALHEGRIKGGDIVDANERVDSRPRWIL